LPRRIAERPDWDLRKPVRLRRGLLHDPRRRLRLSDVLPHLDAAERASEFLRDVPVGQADHASRALFLLRACHARDRGSQSMNIGARGELLTDAENRHVDSVQFT
jgi:hypothetical protein